MLLPPHTYQDSRSSPHQCVETLVDAELQPTNIFKEQPHWRWSINMYSCVSLMQLEALAEYISPSSRGRRRLLKWQSMDCWGKETRLHGSIWALLYVWSILTLLVKKNLSTVLLQKKKKRLRLNCTWFNIAEIKASACQNLLQIVKEGQLCYVEKYYISGASGLR